MLMQQGKSQMQNRAVAPIHGYTLAAFTGARDGRTPSMVSASFLATTGRSLMEQAFEKIQLEAASLWESRQPSNVDGYSIAHKGKDWRDGVIAVWQDATGKLVGGQGNGVPYVDPAFREQKLGREIQLRAFETGLKTLRDFVIFSPAGLAARKSAHRFAVTRAVEHGLAVRSDVLADYPELQPAAAMVR